MKIPQSVRVLFEEIEPRYQALKIQVDKLMLARKEPRWHYESRVKGEQSFALKLETGRVRFPNQPEDFFGATLVVENKSRIADAETFVSKTFPLAYKRPPDPKVTLLEPHNFNFDDLRLYVRWRDDTALPATGLDGVLFEVQIKTFLQHAWGIATHDFIYKAEEIEWSTSRIAYQVKAMLENAELSIGEAKKLTDATMLDRCDDRCKDLQMTIADLKVRWGKDQLPSDLRRLAENILELSYSLEIGMFDIWAAVDEATAADEGAKTLNLSPYASIIASLLRKRGINIFKPLGRNGRLKVFIPLEIELAGLPAALTNRIIRPTTKP